MEIAIGGSNLMQDYGKELIIDLHNCNPLFFTRELIRTYLRELCILINMERCVLHWWDDLHTSEKEKQTEPHLVGTTAIQFIKTSNITIHTLELLRKAYINIFSCKDFDDNAALEFSKNWFGGEVVHHKVIRRI
jgi:S-adenosylmethionine/arginine decarboxylase-like enzyme